MKKILYLIIIFIVPFTSKSQSFKFCSYTYQKDLAQLIREGFDPSNSKKNSSNSNRQNSTINNSPYVNVSDEEDVMRFLRSGYKWTCLDAGRYVLSFTYDYHYSYNTFGLIFWTLNRSDPTGVFINVDVSPGFRSCRLTGEDPVSGKNVRINLFSDGHCESEGFYFNISR